MSENLAYQQLTPSGLGALLPWNPETCVQDLARQARRAALDSGCALVRGMDLDEEDFKLLVRARSATASTTSSARGRPTCSSSTPRGTRGRW